jgi:uncharacterized repeat protein (TIGR01451 family)
MYRCLTHFEAAVRRVLPCGIFGAIASRWLIAICLSAMAASPQSAHAQDSASVETTLIAEVLEKSGSFDGRQAQRLVPATTINQGDVVHYTVRIRNPSSQPARDVVVVQRIPSNTKYVANSASGPAANITFSIDGGVTFGSPRELKVVSPTGLTRPATAEDYTHIRWQLRNVLSPGAVALARFEAVFK